jgi:hypothetical protein
MRTNYSLRKKSQLQRSQGRRVVVSHISQKTSEIPRIFLYAALEMNVCAALFKESRRKFREPTKLHGKSGVWGHPGSFLGRMKKGAVENPRG